VQLKLSASLPSEINRKQVKVNVCRCDVQVVGEIPQHVEKCQLHMRLPGSPNLKNLSSQATGGKWGWGGYCFWSSSSEDRRCLVWWGIAATADGC